METFQLTQEQRFDPAVRIEHILGVSAEGDYTVACWEPGHLSPYHCHPDATEIYFCYTGGGRMRVPSGHSVEITPGAFVVHPPGELHEFTNGPQRSLLFRVRYGADLSARTVAWRDQPDWRPDELDLQYMREHPEDLPDEAAEHRT